MVLILTGILHLLYWSTEPLRERAKQFRLHGTKLLTRYALVPMIFPYYLFFISELLRKRAKKLRTN